jgi:hypothetical protein
MANTPDRRDILIDWAIALMLFGLAALTLFLADDLRLAPEGGALVPPWAEYALSAALMLPLAWRRRYPLTVLVIVGGVFLVYRYVGVWEGTASSIALFLALYSAGALSQHPPATGCEVAWSRCRWWWSSHS